MSRISNPCKPVVRSDVSHFRTLPQWIVKTSLLSLFLILFMGIAAAQPRSRPINNGRRPQPTQQEIDTRADHAARQWGRAVQPNVDRLYDEILRASEQQGR